MCPRGDVVRANKRQCRETGGYAMRRRVNGAAAGALTHCGR
nr:MAG TPA: hypothetical protein [Caudoviricetes sp.]